MSIVRTNEEVRDLLGSVDTCRESLEWLGWRTPLQAWRECTRPDWMLRFCAQMASRPGFPSAKDVARVACDCAELALPKLPENERRPHEAVRIARLWCDGQAGLDELARAAHAARMCALEYGATSMFISAGKLSKALSAVEAAWNAAAYAAHVARGWADRNATSCYAYNAAGAAEDAGVTGLPDLIRQKLKVPA